MGGYIKDHRKELDSEIWLMPPLYHRVWQYLKYKVNHDEAKIPMRDGSTFKILPGQHLTSIRKIADGVGYYEGKVFQKPNPRTIDGILSWMEKKEMIEIERGKTGRGYTLITIKNWSIYQHENTVTGNSQNTVTGNSREVEKTQQYQGNFEVSTVTSNSHEPFQVTVSAYKQEELRIKDIAVAVEEDSKDVQFRLIRDHFTKRRGRGLDVNVEDEGVIFQMLIDGLPTQFICEGIDRSFESFKPKHAMDRINTFKYIAPRIYDEWTKHNERLAMADGTIVIGSFGKKRSGYKSKTEKTNEYLRQAWEDDRYAEVANPEAVHGDQSSVPKLRGV